MLDMWYANRCTVVVEKVVVESATPHFVMLLSGRRAARLSQYDGYFPSSEEAIDYLRAVFKADMEAALTQHERARLRLLRVEEIHAGQARGPYVSRRRRVQ